MKFRKTNKTIWGIFLGRNCTPIEPLHIQKWLSVWTLIRLSMLIIFQWLFTRSKSILETLEQGVKYVNVRSGVFIVIFWSDLTPWSSASIVNIEKVNGHRLGILKPLLNDTG